MEPREEKKRKLFKATVDKSDNEKQSKTTTIEKRE
jgi:hypothetical protein